MSAQWWHWPNFLSPDAWILAQNAPNAFGCRAPPGPARGAYSAPPDSLAGFGEGAGKGKGIRTGEGRGKGKREEGEEGRGGEKGREIRPAIWKSFRRHWKRQPSFTRWSNYTWGKLLHSRSWMLTICSRVANPDVNEINCEASTK